MYNKTIDTERRLDAKDYPIISYSAFKSARKKAKKGKIGIFPVKILLCRGKNYSSKQIKVCFIVMCNRIKVLQEFCETFSFPLMLIQKTKKQRYGYFHVVLSGYQANKMVKFLLGELGRFGKGLRDFK